MTASSPPGRSALDRRVEALVRRLLSLDWGEGRAAALEAWRREVFEVAGAWPPAPWLRHRIGNLLSPALTHAYLLTRGDLGDGEREELHGHIESSLRAALRVAAGGGGAPSEPPSGPLPSPLAGGAASEHPATARPLLLVVDDEERLLRAVERFLRGSRFRFEAYREPFEAMGAFARDPGRYDLALIDVDMPTMTGAELAAALREARPALPIVFATGHALDEGELRAYGLERCPVVEKPFDPGALVATLERSVRAGP